MRKCKCINVHDPVTYTEEDLMFKANWAIVSMVFSPQNPVHCIWTHVKLDTDLNRQQGTNSASRTALCVQTILPYIHIHLITCIHLLHQKLVYNMHCYKYHWSSYICYIW